MKLLILLLVLSKSADFLYTNEGKYIAFMIFRDRSILRPTSKMIERVFTDPYHIVNCGERNGTFYNHNQLLEHELKDYDEINHRSMSEDDAAAFKSEQQYNYHQRTLIAINRRNLPSYFLSAIEIADKFIHSIYATKNGFAIDVHVQNKKARFDFVEERKSYYLTSEKCIE
ncbi:unnamed protein product [Caenorhabditis angaria]|uniref:Uncharacterized protein n=1 Tax=Caenorhabditis angaria TaxID=860376 RepID=A0A9P1IGS7_9PELO|nr:unnamed protein product [Caenorhabditis angaria]